MAFIAKERDGLVIYFNCLVMKVFLWADSRGSPGDEFYHVSHLSMAAGENILSL